MHELVHKTAKGLLYACLYRKTTLIQKNGAIKLQDSIIFLCIILSNIFSRDFLSKAIIKGDTYKTSTSQTAFGRPALLGREPFASLFRSRLWTIRLSWPGGSDKFPAILGRFYGPCPGLRDRCWVFSGKRYNLDIDCGYSVQAWPFSHSPHKRSLSNFLNP